MTTGYIICVIAAMGLLIAYSAMVKNKEFWLMMLYVCVSVVNLGYLLMSLANTIEFAVFGNDVAYFGSVFLSMCMFLTIVRLCGFEIKKAHVITCVTLGAVMFAIIASSPMLPLYYKSVDIEIIDGATKLVKEYGVLHPVYMVYLLGYFAAMIGTIIHSVRKKKIGKRESLLPIQSFTQGLANLNAPALFIGQDTQLNAGDGIVQFLAQGANAAAVDGHNVVLVAQLAHRRDDSGSAGTEDFFQSTISLGLQQFICGDFPLLYFVTPALTKLDDGVAGDTGQD